MATASYELVHGARRLARVFTAASTLTGNAGRAYVGFFQDSLGFITPTRNDGRGQETTDYPGGYWEGFCLALKNSGFTIYGSQLLNYSQANFASFNALGYYPNNHTFCPIIGRSVTSISASATPVITCNDHGLDVNDLVTFTGTNSTPPLAGPYTIVSRTANTFTLTAGQITTTIAGGAAGSFSQAYIPNDVVRPMSFPFSNLGFVGPLLYVNTIGGPVSANYDGATFLLGLSDSIESATGTPNSSTWQNPFILGNPASVAIRCNFSYRAIGACTIKANLYTPFGGGNQVALTTISPTGATGWLEGSLTAPAGTTPYYTMFQLYDYTNAATTGKSVGPFVVGGVQWVLSTVDPADTTTGPGGFAVGPVWAKGGYTLTHLNAELNFAGVAAMAEYMREAKRSADWFVAAVCLAGNDSGSGANSFVYGTDTGALDGSGYSSGTGAATNTAAGFLQNWKSITAFLKAAWAMAGGDPTKLIALHMYHTQSAAPYATYIPACEQALADWIDSGAIGSEIAVVIRGSKVMPANILAAARMYNASGQALSVTAISAANPTEVTVSGSHGISTGDLVAFGGTNSTPALAGPYKATVVNGTKFTVPVNVSGAGSAGTVAFVNKDTPHLQSTGVVAFMQACLDAALASGAEAVTTSGRIILPIPMW